MWFKLDVCARFGLRLQDLARMDPGEVAHMVAYCVLKQQMEARAAGALA